MEVLESSWNFKGMAESIKVSEKHLPDFEIHNPTTDKSHVSNISYKVYMGKTISCRTLSVSTIIHAWSPHVCVYVQECLRTQDSPQSICV